MLGEFQSDHRLAYQYHHLQAACIYGREGPVEIFDAARLEDLHDCGVEIIREV